MRAPYSVGFYVQYILLGLVAAAVILFLWPQTVHNGKDAAQPLSYRDAVSLAAPAVVNVYASKSRQQVSPLFNDPLFQQFFGVPQPQNRRNIQLGSGVIMNAGGYTLTNAHVIRDMDEIRITLQDGRQATAEVVGIDVDTDLAVLRINLDKLPAITIGDSDELDVGDVVLAIGYPFEVGQTVTQGIVSAKGRKRMGITTIEDFIQTDADINPGNSGGALINARGQLVGINTAIVSSTGGSQGIGLATPIKMGLHVMDQIIRNGYVIRGWLGIEVQMLPADARGGENGVQRGGVLVAGVLTGGPADQAGVIPGDIILQVGGQNVTSPQQAIEMISGLAPGSIQDILLVRGWEQIILQARIAERPLFTRS